MIRKIIVLLSFALCVIGDKHHAISKQHIKMYYKEHGHHGDLKHIGSKKPEHHEEYAWSYPSYEFSYSVHDPHTHDKKSQKESRTGDEVKGEYWLIEPDGRKRTVTYNADKHSGFQATVHYSDHHHHIVEHKDDKDDDEKHDHHKEQDKGEEEKEEEKKEENEGGNEENEEDENDENERGEEESRSHKGEIVRWMYGSKWDNGKGDNYRGGDRRDNDEERIGDGHYGYKERYDRDDKRDRDEGRKLEKGYDRNEDRKYDFGKITVYDKLGSYGRRDDKKRDEERKRDEKYSAEERDREESLLWEERRKFDERRGYPLQIAPYSGHTSRINRRFYRHEQQRKIA